MIGGRESADADRTDVSWWEEDLAGQRLDVGRTQPGGGMLKIEQTEFWTETISSRLRATSSPVPSAAEDYFLDEDYEVPEPMLDFGEADAVEAIVVVEESESPRLLDVSESIDSIERRRQEAREAETKGKAPVAEPTVEPVPVPVKPSRPRGTVSRPTYAQQDAPQPRFNMARLLRLTGSLDAVDDRQHWYDLPTKRFRAWFTVGARRQTISSDFLKDLRAAPRGVTLRKHRLPDRWTQLK
jgi:hypothetical protein